MQRTAFSTIHRHPPARFFARAAGLFCLALLVGPAGLTAGCGPSGAVDPQVDLSDAARDVLGTNVERQDGAPAQAGPLDAAAEAVIAVDAAAPDRALPDAAAAPDAQVPADVPPPPDAAPVAPDLAAAEAPPPDAPPEAPPLPDPTGPWVMVTHEAAPPLTNLTVAGTLDWAHFGQGGVGRINRKLGVPARITMMPLANSTVYGYNDRPVRFAWTDGTPTAQVATTADGVSIGEEPGLGFEIKVEGNVNRARVLRVHLGVWGARAHLFTRFNDDSVPPFNDTSLTAGQPGQDRVYVIRFRPANQGQQLLLRWTVESVNQDYGNVTLQAATLSE